MPGHCLFLQISDKDNDIELYTSRIKDLEHQQNKQSVENTELERKLRREIEVVSARNADLETKMVEAASTVGFLFIFFNLMSKSFNWFYSLEARTA